MPTDAILLLLAAVIYGGIFPVNRLAAEAQWPPMGFAFAQSLTAGVILALAAAARGRFTISAGQLLAYLIIGGLVVGLPIGILVSAAPHVDASVLTLVLCLSPTFTLCIGVLAGFDRFDWRTLAGMLLGVAGVAVLALPDVGVVGSDGIGWFLVALIAPVMFAAANNCAKWLRPEGASSLMMAAGTLLGAAVVAGVVMLALGSAALPSEWTGTTAMPLVLATVINAVFFVLFFELVARMGPTRFSIFNYLAVAAGILWSLAVFDEQPAASFWLALVLMLAAMYLVLSRKPN
ncbi:MULTISPECIES: DMT family transporter [Mesorhizobium]|uniref:DMT family transporter n=1 Tax=Mesorhizobium TaxID=68287 RepID=UPI001314D806|nr:MULTISPECIES: DMT family transporter [Mesorhizobium]